MVVMSAAVLGYRLLSDEDAEAVPRDVAERYVQLIASGDETDLQEAAAMTATADPEVLRTAGAALTEATQRIEVVDVRTAGVTEAAPEGLSFPGVFDDFRGFDVEYRLAGEEYADVITVGRLPGSAGDALDDWRVLTPLLGEIAWPQSGLPGGGFDLGIGEKVRIGLSVYTYDQRLYPAVYPMHGAMSDLFTAAATEVSVPTGRSVTPELSFTATDAANKRVGKAFRQAFKACGATWAPGCPVESVAADAGARTWRRDWWVRLVREPTLEVTPYAVTYTGGRFSFRGPGGVEQLGFHGSVPFDVDGRKIVMGYFESASGPR